MIDLDTAADAIADRKWTPRPELLLCANTVKPMHGVVPRVILGESWWNETRQAAYRSTNYHCLACGVHKRDAECHQWLEGHEVYQTDYQRGRMTYVETVPLCHYCHNFIHDGRLEILVAKKEITVEKFAAVMAHGRAVLRRAGIKKPRCHYRGEIAEWKKWRLVLDGKEYPPIYRNQAAWEKAFGVKGEPS